MSASRPIETAAEALTVMLYLAFSSPTEKEGRWWLERPPGSRSTME